MGGRGAVSKSSNVPKYGFGPIARKVMTYGRISLDAADYSGFSENEVLDFMQNLPYEVSVFFSPDGEVIFLNSDYEKEQCFFDARELTKAILQRGYNGIDYTFMHNHPLNDVGHEAPLIFSPEDIGTFTQLIQWGQAGQALPTKFGVRVQDGREYRLDYVGGETESISQFEREYGNMLHTVWENYKKQGLSKQEVADLVDNDMDTYLKDNASKYGFRYTSNVR